MKRWFTRISPGRAAFGGLICLILGAATTVGVAWGLAAVSNPLLSRDWGETSRQGVSVDWDVWRGVGNTRVASDKWRERETTEAAPETEPMPAWWDEMSEPDSWEEEPPSLPQPLEAVFNPSEAFLSTPDVEPEIGETNIVGATGLPMLAMWYEEYYFLGSGLVGQPILVWTGLRGGIETGLTPWDEDTPRVLPLRVIWPGFLIDTLFYAVLWLGLIVGFGAARRGLRKKRGLCPMCAYDLRGGRSGPAGSRTSPVGCPECGWNRAEAESSQ